MFVRLTETGFTILCTVTREAWYYTTVRLEVRQKAGPASIFRRDRVMGNVQWWFKERFRPVITEVFDLHVTYKLRITCRSQITCTLYVTRFSELCLWFPHWLICRRFEISLYYSNFAGYFPLFERVDYFLTDSASEN